jgi:hypothetical protein
MRLAAAIPATVAVRRIVLLLRNVVVPTVPAGRRDGDRPRAGHPVLQCAPNPILSEALEEIVAVL